MWGFIFEIPVVGGQLNFEICVQEKRGVFVQNFYTAHTENFGLEKRWKQHTKGKMTCAADCNNCNKTMDKSHHLNDTMTQGQA